MRIQIPEFATKEELFDYLRKNHDAIIKEKKSLQLEGILHKTSLGAAAKSYPIQQVLDTTLPPDTIRLKTVMNTTMVMDSHMDVHDNGLWNKSLSDNPFFYHLQEHKAQFDHVIDNRAKAYVQTMTWKDLGIDAQGTTEALVFESTLTKDKNPQMYQEYKSLNVNNHSVGMRYIKLLFAMDSTDPQDAQYKENYDNYVSKMLNPDEAKSRGYFWIVKEAALSEGSAVLMGSNVITPTLQIFTPSIQPDLSTGKSEPDYSELKEVLQSIKFK